MKKSLKKLNLSRETLRSLEAAKVRQAAGGTGGWSCFVSCVAECATNESIDAPCEPSR